MGFGFDTFSLVNFYVNLGSFELNFYANLVLLNITQRLRVMFLTSQIFIFSCFCVVFQTMEIVLLFCSILILLSALSPQCEPLPWEGAWEDWTPKGVQVLCLSCGINMPPVSISLPLFLILSTMYFYYE